MDYTHLTEEERYQIDDLRREGLSKRKIAKSLGRSASTLSRELARNTGERGWRPRQAQLKAIERLVVRGRNNASKVSDSPWQYAEKHLIEDQWSPEQISGRAKQEGLRGISHEVIYQRILINKQAGGNWYPHLRCKKKRKKRYGSARLRQGSISNRVDRDKRPAIGDTRIRTGDWEGDTIIGSHTGGAVIASMVERKSRYTVLAKSKNKTSFSVIQSINLQMRPIADLVHTVTLDNGGEFSSHETMAAMLQVCA